MSSASSPLRPALLVPFVYTLATRLRSRRDFLYNAAMAWIPALAIALLSGIPLSTALIGFALGYLAFIAVYEIGYLANDVWDARRDPSGRRRLDAEAGPAWIAAFATVRIATFAGIAGWTGWWAQPLWAGGFLALVLAFAAHNLIGRRARLLTFPVLTVLRFVLPALGILDLRGALVAFAVAAVTYLPPRWLAYAESKDLVAASVRARPHFRSLFVLALVPLAALAAWKLGSIIPIALHLYALAVTVAGERLKRPG